MNKIAIDKDRCKGCYLCIEECPKKLIEISSSLNSNSYYPVIFKDSDGLCSACMRCALICPEVAIEVFKEK